MEDNKYDVVASIGLLEHFDNPGKVLEEKIRVTKPGGWIINYIVPNKEVKIQKFFNFINYTLRIFINNKITKNQKDPVYRTKYKIDDYKKFIPKNKIDKILSFGTYPIPMISPSPDFPFTLCPDFIERINVIFFKILLKLRFLIFNKNPWSCNEETGHAILIAFRKK